MDKESKLRAIKRKTRQRLLFSGITLVMYFSYVLNYTAAGSFLGEKIGSSQLTGSLMMFMALIVIFIGMEILFLALNRDQES